VFGIMKATENRYSFSFISGALYLKECLAVARLLRQHGDWVIVRDKLIEDNLLRQRSRESSVRLFREIRYRLQELTAKELVYLCDADPQDQRHLLFIAVCLRYRFIREFIQEVLLPKALSSDLQLYPGDIGRFFESKGNEPEVERLKPSSRAKVGQVLIRMLVEGGLLDSVQSQRIVRSFPSRALARVVVSGDSVRLRFLLLTDSDIRELKGRHAE
jgi:hypothetical protein